MRVRVSGLILALAISSGCASQNVASLASIQNKEINKLAAACWRAREGERFVFGPGPVWIGCKQWAEQRVAPRVDR